MVFMVHIMIFPVPYVGCLRLYDDGLGSRCIAGVKPMAIISFLYIGGRGRDGTGDAEDGA
jgi:hypothetical protein